MRFHLIVASIVCLIVLVSFSGCKKDDEDNSRFYPVVVTSDVSEITYNSFISGGKIISDGGYQIIERGVCWSNSPEPTISDSKSLELLNLDEFVSHVRGLSFDTYYYVRAYATNVKGTGYGKSIPVETKQSPCGGSAVFVDQRDGSSYLIIPIGDQCWMANNLRYLPMVSPSAFGHYQQEHYYVYGYHGNSVDEAKNTNHYFNYGVLYNWPAASTACPEGWHLPSDDEWTTLTDYLGGEAVAGRMLKSTRIISDPHPRWSTPFIDATNETGFSALPGGYRNDIGSFYFLGFYASWWTSTEGSDKAAHNRYMLHYGKQIFPTFLNKSYGFNVRCIKDAYAQND